MKKNKITHVAGIVFLLGRALLWVLKPVETQSWASLNYRIFPGTEENSLWL